MANLAESVQPHGVQRREVWGWLLIAGAVVLSSAPFDAVLQAVRKERLQISISAVITFIHPGLSLVLLPCIGIEGVGMAALCSAIAGHLTLRHFCH